MSDPIRLRLEHTRDRALEAFGGVGRPCIELPMDKIGVIQQPPRLVMTIDDLIEWLDNLPNY